MAPQRWMEVPMACSTASARSRSAASPPAMMANSPDLARGTPPLTGQSIIATPTSARSAAMLRVAPGWPEVMSMNRLPLAMAGFTRAATWATCLEVGRMVITASAPEAASAAPAAAWPPISATKRATRPASVSHTVTSKPFDTRLAAIGQPILPMPMNARRFTWRTSSWQAWPSPGRPWAGRPFSPAWPPSPAAVPPRPAAPHAQP